MTLAVACKGHEGLALAADSRATAEVSLASGQRDTTYFDNATKLFGVTGQQYNGVLTWGQFFFGNATQLAGSFPILRQGSVPGVVGQHGILLARRGLRAAGGRELQLRWVASSS